MSLPDDPEAPDLYLVYLDADLPGEIHADLAPRALTDGLWLVRTGLTRSQLYHRIKHAARPDALLVARLDGDPKFKGMEAGALKWLRDRP